MKNNHQLIVTALHIGLDGGHDFHGKDITLEVPQIFDAELEPITTVVIAQIDDVPYSITIARAV